MGSIEGYRNMKSCGQPDYVSTSSLLRGRSTRRVGMVKIAHPTGNCCRRLDGAENERENFFGRSTSQGRRFPLPAVRGARKRLGNISCPLGRQDSGNLVDGRGWAPSTRHRQPTTVCGGRWLRGGSRRDCDTPPCATAPHCHAPKTEFARRSGQPRAVPSAAAPAFQRRSNTAR